MTRRDGSPARSRSAATRRRPATPGRRRWRPPASARSAAGPRPRPTPTARPWSRSSDMFGRTVSQDRPRRSRLHLQLRPRRAPGQPRSSPARRLTYDYLNTGWSPRSPTAPAATPSYGYDAAGNKTHRNHDARRSHRSRTPTATYDALGRMTCWSEAGRRRCRRPRSFGNMTSTATSAGGAELLGPERHGRRRCRQLHQNQWYRYDAMNRVDRREGHALGRPDRGGTPIPTTRPVGASRRPDGGAEQRPLRCRPTARPRRVTTPDSPMIWPDDGGGQRTIVNFAFSSPHVETTAIADDGTARSRCRSRSRISPRSARSAPRTRRLARSGRRRSEPPSPTTRWAG